MKWSYGFPFDQTIHIVGDRSTAEATSLEPSVCHHSINERCVIAGRNSRFVQIDGLRYRLPISRDRSRDSREQNKSFVVSCDRRVSGGNQPFMPCLKLAGRASYSTPQTGRIDFCRPRARNENFHSSIEMPITPPSADLSSPSPQRTQRAQREPNTQGQISG